MRRGREGAPALGERVWCGVFRPLAPEPEAACTFGVQRAAVEMLFPAGSHSRWACASASHAATGGAQAHAGAWVPAGMGAREHAGRDTLATLATSGLGHLGL